MLCFNFNEAVHQIKQKMEEKVKRKEQHHNEIVNLIEIQTELKEKWQQVHQQFLQILENSN